MVLSGGGRWGVAVRVGACTWILLGGLSLGVHVDGGGGIGGKVACVVHRCGDSSTHCGGLHGCKVLMRSLA